MALAWFDKGSNFGDQLSPAVMAHYTRHKPLWVSPDFEGKVIAIGSIAAYMRPNDIVLGAGSIRPERRTLPRGVRVLAVRGPMTAELLGLSPDAVRLGDPGALAPEAFGISRDPDATHIGLIPHLEDRGAVRALLNSPRVRSSVKDTAHLRVIDLSSSPRSVVSSIASSRVCLSSSLHGLVVAEALGVPAVWVSVSDRITGGTFKFLDYFAGTGREGQTALTLDEGLEYAVNGEVPAFETDLAPLRVAFRQLNSLLGLHQH